MRLRCRLAGRGPSPQTPLCAKLGNTGSCSGPRGPQEPPLSRGQGHLLPGTRGRQLHLRGKHLLLVRDKTVVLPYLFLILYNIHAQTSGPSSGILRHSVNSAPRAGATRRSHQSGGEPPGALPAPRARLAVLRPPERPLPLHDPRMPVPDPGRAEHSPELPNASRDRRPRAGPFVAFAPQTQPAGPDLSARLQSHQGCQAPGVAGSNN